MVGGAARSWHAGIPSAPSDFPSTASFALTAPEARYLKGRVLENHRKSLFAFMLDRDFDDADAKFAWQHPGAQHAPEPLTREVEHARCFSEVMHGAAILYNLYVAEMEPRHDETVEQCDLMLSEWLALMAERRAELLVWHQKREDFWALLAGRDHIPSLTTRGFVDEWARRVLSGDPATLRGSDSTRELIFRREVQIKGEIMARCKSREMRWRWNGGSGLGRLDFRWSNARVLLRDIAAGLAGAHA